MPDYGKYYPSRWLKPPDIDYGERVLHIREVGPERVGREKEEKLVASFVEMEKCLILNKTNAGVLADLARSADFEVWGGLAVMAYHKTIDVGSETHDVVWLKPVLEPETDEIPL